MLSAGSFSDRVRRPLLACNAAVTEDDDGGGGGTGGTGGRSGGVAAVAAGPEARAEALRLEATLVAATVACDSLQASTSMRAAATVPAAPAPAPPAGRHAAVARGFRGRVPRTPTSLRGVPRGRRTAGRTDKGATAATVPQPPLGRRRPNRGYIPDFVVAWRAESGLASTLAARPGSCSGSPVLRGGRARWRAAEEENCHPAALRALPQTRRDATLTTPAELRTWVASVDCSRSPSCSHQSSAERLLGWMFLHGLCPPCWASPMRLLPAGVVASAYRVSAGSYQSEEGLPCVEEKRPGGAGAAPGEGHGRCQPVSCWIIMVVEVPCMTGHVAACRGVCVWRVGGRGRAIKWQSSVAAWVAGDTLAVCPSVGSWAIMGWRIQAFLGHGGARRGLTVRYTYEARGWLKQWTRVSYSNS